MQAPPALMSTTLQAITGFSDRQKSTRPWPGRGAARDDTVFALTSQSIATGLLRPATIAAKTVTAGAGRSDPPIHAITIQIPDEDEEPFKQELRTTGIRPCPQFWSLARRLSPFRSRLCPWAATPGWAAPPPAVSFPAWCGYSREPGFREESTMAEGPYLSLAEIDRRIAIARDNIRQLIEQAAAFSGAEDEDRNADRIAQQTEELEKLIKQRDALQKK
jgi:hypothetical protein